MDYCLSSQCQGSDSLLFSSIRMANIRLNYNEECEALINKHINTKLCHGYIYLYMCSYYNRDDQALTGFADFFWKASEEEYKHAGMLIKYQTMRGGRVMLQDITKPTVMEWNTPMEAMMTVFNMEKEVTKTLTDLHLVTFIQKYFLTRQIMDMKTIGDFLTKMKRAGTGLGFYMIDKEIAAYTKKWIEDTKTENFIMEEDVTKIVKTGGDNKTTVIMEKYWM